MAVASTLFLLTTADAFADKRVALVIGNSAYRNVAWLPNPEKDAASIAKLFRSAGFDTVVAANNVGNLEFKRAIRKFEDMAAGSDIAVVFYAGHGIEIGGVNYLIPVDAMLARDRDAQDEAISLDRLVQTVEGAKRLRLIILDACRDNPFGKKIKRMMAVRSIAPGLGKIEPTSSNTLIAYAAKAGSTAEDGDGEHSPFSTALLKNLTIPGLDVRLAFGRIRDEVMKMTGNRQEPFVYGSLGGSTVALVTAAPQRAAPAATAIDNIVRDYEFAERIGTKEAWESFMSAHRSSGFYYNLAKAARDKMAAADRKSGEEAGVKAETEANRKAERQTQTQADMGTKTKQTEPQAKPAPSTEVALAPAQTANETVTKPDIRAIEPGALARQLQIQLKRVGCDPGTLDGAWNDGTVRAMARFNASAHTQFNVKVASRDALEAIKEYKERVCPLVCGKGLRAEQDRCIAIACKPGRVLNKEGECVRKATSATRPRAGSGSANSGASIYCNSHSGCRPVPKNCKVESTITGYGSDSVLVCK